LIEEKSAHFVTQVKAIQPRLLEAAARAFAGVFDAHETYDKAHRRIEHRYYTVVPITEQLACSLDYPHARSFVRVYRERCDLADVPIGDPETTYYITDLSGAYASVKGQRDQQRSRTTSGGTGASKTAATTCATSRTARTSPKSARELRPE